MASFLAYQWEGVGHPGSFLIIPKALQAFERPAQVPYANQAFPPHFCSAPKQTILEPNGIGQ